MAVKDNFFNLGNNPNLDSADTGIDPATGRVLTNEERRKIFARRSILSKQNRQAIAKNTKMSFGGGALVLSSRGNVDKRVQSQGGALVAPVNSLTKRVTALEESMSNMATVLANIRKVIVKGNETDAKIQDELAKQQNLLFQERLRKNAEDELEESDLEAEAEPEIDKQQKKTFGFFEKIKKALLALFGGFVLKKAFKLFTAWREGNTEELEKLKVELNSMGQQLFTGIFYFNKIINGLLKIAGNFVKSIAKLTGKIITFPFRIAGRIIRTAVRKAFVGIKRAIGPGMRKAIKGFFNIGKNKAGKEVGKKVAKEVAKKSVAKVAKRGLLGSIPLIGTGLDIWGAVGEGMKGNWTGAGLYTAGAITSLIPGMQGVSGVLSVSAMGQSIHQDLKRDAKNQNIDMTGGDNVEISGMGNDDFAKLGAVEKRKPIVQVVSAGGGSNNKEKTKTGYAGNFIPTLPSSNPDNLYESNAKNTYNAYTA